jgi:type IV pilus assembly protein PilM
MARSVIGLDVGTNAVTVAEVVSGDPPRLAAFGQVALPRDAMRDGEVVDGAAVADAIRRLRSEVGIRRGGVRVGLASPRLIVRQVEMPVMSHDDLAGALRFQAADLIPFSIDEAFLDFTILDQYQPVDSEPVMRVLLAAAQRTMVEQLVEAVESGGFAVDAVDLIPLALIRALGAGSGFAGAEGIVSLGGGTSCVVVHEAGVPRFVRVLGSGGRQLTDAISASLDLAPDAAESIKRQLANGSDPLVDRARAAIDRPLGALLDEVRSSIDYYRNQPGATALSQVLVTGGTAQLGGVIERLGALLGVSAFPADPRSRLTIGDIGFAPEELPRLDPYLPAAIGLAIADPARGPVMNLLPGGRKPAGGAASSNKTKLVIAGAVGGLLLLAGLAYPVLQRRDEKDKLTAETEQIENERQALQAKADSLQEVAQRQLQVEALEGQVQSVLASDVSWATMLHEVAKQMPNDVWLTSFSGTVDRTVVVPVDTGGRGNNTTTTLAEPGQVPTAPTGAINGTVTVQAVGLDFPAVAGWINGIFGLIKLDGVWVQSATQSEIADNVSAVQFTSSARLTDEAKSDRAEERSAGGE